MIAKICKTLLSMERHWIVNFGGYSSFLKKLSEIFPPLHTHRVLVVNVVIEQIVILIDSSRTNNFFQFSLTKQLIVLLSILTTLLVPSFKALVLRIE